MDYGYMILLVCTLHVFTLPHELGELVFSSDFLILIQALKNLRRVGEEPTGLEVE
jgi:hypothetical protein